MPKRSWILALPVLLAVVLAAPGGRAESTWFNPLSAYPQSYPPGWLILEPGHFTSLDVRATRTWEPRTVFPPGVAIPLTVHPGEVTSLTICYKIKTARPHRTVIWRAQLISMSTPMIGTRLVMDDPTELWSNFPTCYTYRSFDRRYADVDGALLLHLYLAFGDTDDVITIGGIELTMDEPSPPPVTR
jgi:hypothetical protein